MNHQPFFTARKICISYCFLLGSFAAVAQENENVDAIADKFSAPTYTLDVAQMLRQFFPGAAVAGIGDPGGHFRKTVVSSETGVNDPGYSAGDCGGILHFANAGECSWQEYAQWAVNCCREAGLPLKARIVGAFKLKDMVDWVARRPVYSVLSTAKYTESTDMSPRTWRDAVADYITRFYSKK